MESRDAWFEAVRSGDVDEVRRLLDDGADPAWRDDRIEGDGVTALIDAATIGHEMLVRILLDRGPEVNARSATGWTPLMRACNLGSLRVARLLLDAGADPDLRNDEGYTAYARVPGNCGDLAELMKRVSSASALER